MALQRDTLYAGRFDTGDSAHPQGAFKNRTTPTAQDGSYLEAQWLNDWDGFFGSLLNKAGLTPDGNVDAVGDSQYFTALQELVSLGDYITAGGAANAITLTHATPITSYKDGQVFRFRSIAANTGTTTINVDGLGDVTLYGSAGLACQGGEIALNGYAIAVYSSVLSGVVLLACVGGSLQIPDATKSNHAISLGQIIANLATSGYIKIPGVDLSGNHITILIQYAGATNGGSGSSISLTFPLTFSESPYLALSGTIDSGGGSQSSVYSRSTTGAVLTVKEPTGTTPARVISGYILAIGKL